MPAWWHRYIGPLVTLATVAAIALVDRHLAVIPNPGAVFLLAVMFSAYSGGILSGLVSSAITVGFSIVYFSESGQPFAIHAEDFQRVRVLMVCTPIAAVLVGLLKARTVQALRRERDGRLAVEATNRRLATLHAALDEIDRGIVLLDRELRARFINKAFRALSKISDAMAESAPPFVALTYHGRDTRAYAVPDAALDAYVAERVRLVRAGDRSPIDIRLSTGDTIRFKCTVLPDGGRMLSYIEVTDLVQRADEWADLASVDGLTGLFNRRHFLELAESEWSRFDRYERPLSLMMIDVDRFKSINDRFGHDVGDRVIEHVASICREGKRTSDIVARIGGEEFVMLLPETPLESAMLVAERLRRRIADSPLLDAAARVALTASIGVAEAGNRTDGVAALMKDADEALYRAKNAGRDRVVAATTEPPVAPIALAS
jgi:diguanylate cyclase (GGDEF)-like protein